jgi:hypothetical protein
MKRSPRPRTAAELSKSLHQQLNMYALAASAAGVGLLATQPAEAKVVYTPAHAKVFQPVPIDLNRDGIVDFNLLAFGTVGFGTVVYSLLACQFTFHTSEGGTDCLSTNSNAIRAMVSNGRLFGAALRGGARIQGGDRFTTYFKCGSVAHGETFTSWRGPWVNGGKGVKNRYLGLKFKIKGRVHFGWARITVTTTSHNFTATLTGYAYETIPGKEIIAGATAERDVITVSPATLGHLAAGASEIPAWRVKQTAATTH